MLKYIVNKTDIGLMLIAGNTQGICLVAFADTEQELHDVCAARVPGAIHLSDEQLQIWANEIIKMIADPLAEVNLPLDLQGTTFERAVWEALHMIPAGETRTYSEIATQVGKPKAVRAVGRACGNNPVAIVVPCHRVIGSNGKLTGYRWGIRRKQQLLMKEAEQCPALVQ
ncbi:MAG: methylated-DNA--[protein]-cysteine S-methyltransferase [Zavarzinella sp.]